MALSMSDNESYTSVKWEDFVFARGGCVLEPDDAQVFVQEEVLCSGRREQGTWSTGCCLQKGDILGLQGHRELNVAECVVSCCGGLEERLARKKAS